MGRNDRQAASSRREFVIAAGAGAAIAATPAWAASPALAGPAPQTALGLLAGAAMADWQQRVGDLFVEGESGAKLTLVAVEPVTAGGRRPGGLRRRHGFTALFETACPGAPAGDTIYALRRPRQGSLALHLGPRVAAGPTSRYVAVFG